jgi:hypothetical protein
MAGYEFQFTAKRRAGFYLLKVVLPILLIVAMSWTVFWIDPRQVGPNVSVATTTILALVAYRFAIAADLPRIPYLTRLEAFLTWALLLVFAALGEVVVMTTLVSRGRLTSAVTIGRWSRLVHPLIVAGVLAWTILL